MSPDEESRDQRGQVTRSTMVPASLRNPPQKHRACPLGAQPRVAGPTSMRGWIVYDAGGLSTSMSFQIGRTPGSSHLSHI